MKALFLLFLVTACFADERNKIVLVDTGINLTEQLSPYICKDGHFGVYKPLQDENGHGSAIASLMSKYINRDKTCIISYRWISGYEGNESDLNVVLHHLYKNYSKDIKIVNMSLGGPSRNNREKNVILNLISMGLKVVVAAGNENTDLDKTCNYFPACYEIKSHNFFVVTSKNTPLRNYGGPAIYKENGVYYYIGKTWSGTSMATGVKSAKLAAEME